MKWTTRRPSVRSALVMALGILASGHWAAGQDAGRQVALRPEGEPARNAKDHPLYPVLEIAYDGLSRINRDILDYSCVLIRRERIEGHLTAYQHIQAKIRHERKEGHDVVTPFSVYMKFLGPADVEGREVLYVAGQNNGDLIARRGGRRSPSMTLLLDPTGPIAMEGNRYPVTDVGIYNLVRRLIQVAESDMQHDECQVDMFNNAAINGRSCTHIQVTHPVRREHFQFHIARVYIDDELRIPIYYAAYGWPSKDDGKPVLLEEYAYTDVNLNVGFTNRDFRHSNPDYKFQLKQ